MTRLDDLERFGWTADSSDSRARARDAVERSRDFLDRASESLVLPLELFDRLVAFGRAAAPEECVGIGIGPADEVAEFHPVANVHPTPVTRYEVSAADQLRLHLRAEVAGWETTLVFHTHPATEPYPSATDLELAAWPDATYLILSLAATEPLSRAYRIVAGAVTELPVVVRD